VDPVPDPLLFSPVVQGIEPGPPDLSMLLITGINITMAYE
jgi:hypothetical protein